MEEKQALTIEQSTAAFLEDLADARRSANTIRTYQNGLNNFRGFLEDAGLDPETETTAQLTEEHVRDFLSWLGAEGRAKATINLYLAAVRAYIEFLDQQELIPQINTSRLAGQLRKRAPRPGRRLPQFPREEIEKVLEHAEVLAQTPAEDEEDHLINLRDRAFILVLADTGLRVHDACALKRKDIDWNEGRAIIIGKGDKEAVVRFSERSLAAMKHYLNERSGLDQSSGRQLATLPVFTGHGPRNVTTENGIPVNKFRHMNTETGRAIIRRRVAEALGEEMVGQITPHSFRHYFVTIVLHATGGNIRIAQELARHSQISTTQRYTHLVSGELDEAYHETFNESGK